MVAMVLMTGLITLLVWPLKLVFEHRSGTRQDAAWSSLVRSFGFATVFVAVTALLHWMTEKPHPIWATPVPPGSVIASWLMALAGGTFLVSLFVRFVNSRGSLNALVGLSLVLATAAIAFLQFGPAGRVK